MCDWYGGVGENDEGKGREGSLFGVCEIGWMDGWMDEVKEGRIGLVYMDG